MWLRQRLWRNTKRVLCKMLEHAAETENHTEHWHATSTGCFKGHARNHNVSVSDRPLVSKSNMKTHKTEGSVAQGCTLNGGPGASGAAASTAWQTSTGAVVPPALNAGEDWCWGVCLTLGLDLPYQPLFAGDCWASFSLNMERPFSMVCLQDVRLDAMAAQVSRLILRAFTSLFQMSL